LLLTHLRAQGILTQRVVGHVAPGGVGADFVSNAKGLVMRSNLWIVFVVCAGLVATGCTGKYKDQIADQSSQISQLESKVRSLEGDLEQEKARNEELNAELAKTLSDYRENQQVMVEMKDAQSIVTVSDAVLFGSGNADLSDSGVDIVDRITTAVKKYPDRSIRIEGYTDNVPIGEMLKDRFPSNWELSAARACSVLRYMYWKHNVNPEQLSAIGFGEYRPVASNDTAEGRAKNRRVVIIIGPKQQSPQ
jgi:chemotaxis protein MotB